MDTSTSTSISKRTLSGSGRLIGDLHFTITLADDSYSVEQVCDRLNIGDIPLYFEDTTLFDDDGEIIGTVQWREDKGNFVVRAADPLVHDPSAMPTHSVRRSA